MSGKVDTTLSMIKELVKGGGDHETLFKKVCELLRGNFAHYSWVGIYVVDGDHLVLKAFAGDHETEHIRIKIGEGICGLAAETGKTVVVPDVSKNFKYIMCFASTKSEIVVPIKAGDNVFGEIDIDSNDLDAFAKTDERLLEEAAEILSALFK